MGVKRFLGTGLIIVGILSLLLTSCRSSPVRPGWSQRGIASWYGPNFQGRPTANGESFDMNDMTAAHRTLPFHTVVEVENLDNGRRTSVRINDRGPFIRGRIIDLSKAAARSIQMIGNGTAEVRITILQSPLTKEESAYLVQAGAYREKDRAETVARHLRKHFGEVQVEASGAYYRVRILGLKGLTAAKEAQQRVLDFGYEALLIHSDLP